MQKIIIFIKKETVLLAALALALISMFIVPPDKKYLSYIDYRTISLLFCLMAVMAGFQKKGIFQNLAVLMLRRVRNSRQIAGILVFLCFFSGMLITNDVALITFVPFAIMVLHLAKAEHYSIPVVVLQTVAANLGSMLTPIGNPQNLYLYSWAGMGLKEFIYLMLPFWGMALLLLGAALVSLKKESVDLHIEEKQQKAGRMSYEVVVYVILFVLCLFTVVRWLRWQQLFVVVFVVIGILDKKVLKQVDYSLLFTFIGFFVFVGNMERIPMIRETVKGLVEGREIITAVVSSQIISNVPTALLLSGFTDDWKGLIIGTNLGGLGTLIASMASLISFKYIAKEYPEMKRHYVGYFTWINIIFLVLLYALSLVL